MAARYQYGNLTKRKRKKGPDVWQFRWTENGLPKSMLIGTVEKLPTMADAERAIEHLRIRINAQVPEQQFHEATVGALIDRFLAEYAPKRCRQKTIKDYESLFRVHIRPRWGDELAPRVKSMAAENWLENHPGSRQVKSHIKRLMHTLFQAALRWEMVGRNPIDFRMAAARLKIPRILTPGEFKTLLAELAEPYKTMVLTVACLGLRVSEMSGLKWGDIDWTNRLLRIERSFVDGNLNSTKTEASGNTLPLDPALAAMLMAHRSASAFAADSDFVFAARTGKPYRECNLLTQYLKPAALRAGIGNIGWHTFRHTYASLLHSLGTAPGIQKELLRHADIATTMNVYTHAYGEEKRLANAQIVQKLYQSVPENSQAAQNNRSNYLN